MDKDTQNLSMTVQLCPAVTSGHTVIGVSLSLSMHICACVCAQVCACGSAHGDPNQIGSDG